MYQVILNDALDIAYRIREIDSCYGIRYNLKTKVLEIYDRHNFSLILLLPFSELDARTINYARETRRERIDALVKEIDFYNEKKERERKKTIIENANILLEEKMSKNGER